MIEISFENDGGVLDSCTVDTTAQAAIALIAMVNAAGVIRPGDKFVVTGTVEDET